MSLVGRSLRKLKWTTKNRRALHCIQQQYPSNSRLVVQISALQPHYHSYRTFSSDERLGRTLYRQLLRWAHDTDDDIPLSNVMGKPVILHPPTNSESEEEGPWMGAVSKEALQKLTEKNDDYWIYVSNLLPPHSQVMGDAPHHKLVVPIQRASHVGQLVRAVYRINQSDVNVDKEMLKQRTSLAFKALKDLNEASRYLESEKAQREQHLDRTGVHYRLGQVVQHKMERWRGVVFGWFRDVGLRTTSLTSKMYETGKDVDPLDIPADEQDDARIQYYIVLDEGDAHLLGGKHQLGNQQRLERRTGITYVRQSELELVKDKDLLRIRSYGVTQHFERFDMAQKRFIPDEYLAYAYPMDVEDLQNCEALDATRNLRRQALGESVLSSVLDFSARLERLISEESCLRSPLLASYRDRLSALSKGDYFVSSRDTLVLGDVSTCHSAALHLRHLLELTRRLSDFMGQRKIADENRDKIHYRLGEIVQHKKYRFRGVIVAWDPTPTVDVSQWDGLTGIDNASDLPFYTIVPDQNDCIEAFGGERPFRYVCEANLEPCPRSRTILNVDLDPEWEMDHAEAKYIPPDELKFAYAEDVGDDGVTLSCFSRIMAEMNRLHLAIRDPTTEQDRELASIADRLSMNTLLELLKVSDSWYKAEVFEDAIKEIWKAHSDTELRRKLELGTKQLLNGNKERALVTFNQVVEEDPSYAEAWNKVSTCQFMMGNMQSSLEAAERTLELEPRHFQAMNGLGLVQYETRRYQLAIDTFRRSLEINPWSSVSTRLAACLDLVFDPNASVDEDDEQGADEGTAPYQSKT